MAVDSKNSAWPYRHQIQLFLDRNLVKNGILAVIIFNAVTLGLSTSSTLSANYGDAFRTIDAAVLTIFVLELTLKFYAYGLRFFANAWNIFDLFVVSVGLLPQGNGLSALRGLRVTIL